MAPAPEQPHFNREWLEIHRYDPEILPQLEHLLHLQVSTGTHYPDANTCLLRFYQFFPERMNAQAVTHILIKALMAFPSSSFLLSQCLIPERMQMEEPFTTLITLRNYLEAGRFREFWATANDNRHIIDQVPGFDAAIQRYAVFLLEQTYQRLPRSALIDAVNMDQNGLNKLITEKRSAGLWTVSDGGQVIGLPHTQANAPAPRAATEKGFALEHAARYLSTVTA